MTKLPASPPTSEFPSDVLKWMKKNAAPKMALKLMQICKYFQHYEFPYFVVTSLQNKKERWKCEPFLKKSFQEMDLKNLKKPLWILTNLYLEYNKQMIMDFVPKIAVYDISFLNLNGLKDIEFEQFRIFTASGNVKSLILSDTVIKNNMGKAVPFENILQCLPKILRITIMRNSNSFFSHQKASEIVPETLENITLTLIQDYFNLEECFKFIQNNQHIYFTYNGSYRDETQETLEFSNRLQALTNTLIQAWNPTNKPPWIVFCRQTAESKEKIRKLRKGFNKN